MSRLFSDILINVESCKPWLKMWVEWIDDPKMLSLSLAEQGAWWRVVTLAQKCMADGFLVKGNGAPLSLNEIARALRITAKANRRIFDSMIEKMAEQGSLHWDHKILVVTNFADRQKKLASETPDALRERQQRRRQKMWEEHGIKDSGIPLQDRLFVIERDKAQCQHCGKQGIRVSTDSPVVNDPEDNTPFEFDHVLPKARGGQDDPDNLLLSCRSCNRARNVRMMSQVSSDNPPLTSSPLNNPPTAKEGDVEVEAEVEKRRDTTVTKLLQSSTVEAVLAEISQLYEKEFGIITPILSEKFKDFAENYRGQLGWIHDAFKEACSQNVRKWSYVETILETCQAEGRKPHGRRKQPAGDQRPAAHRRGDREATAEELRQSLER